MSIPLPLGKSYHCFLTHNWADDNHERVSKINAGLKQRGLVTWFDEDRMNGQIRDKMTDGIDGSCCLVVFMTKIYEAKVNSGSMTDNCYFEFNYASNSNMANYRIAAAMEPAMIDPRNFNNGRFKAELGGLLFVDMTKVDDPVMLERQVDVLFAEVHRLVTLFATRAGEALPNIPVAPLPTKIASKTPLETLDYQMAIKLLLEIGCPEGFESELSTDVRKYFNGSYLKHITSPEELKEECNLSSLRLPVVRRIFSDLQSFQTQGLPAEILTKLQPRLIEPSTEVITTEGTVVQSETNTMLESQHLNEDNLDPKDIALVVDQSGCTRQQAITALINNDNDLVNAILELTV